MLVNKDMITLARESRGWTQAALASELRISQSKISKYEAGAIEVSEEDLEELARVLRFRIEFFLQEDAVYGFGSPCIYHRKRASTTVGDLRRVHACVNVKRIQVDRLLRNVEMRAPLSFHRMDIDSFNGDPAAIARLLRKAWSLPNGPVSNVVSAIENAGGVVVDRDFDVDELDAVSQWAPNQPPLFFVNSGRPTDRLRWSLIHEVGHIVMHTIPSTNQEAEADKFAAEFLMPEREIRVDLSQQRVTLESLAALKMKWKVSMAALARCAHDLGITSSSEHQRIFVKMSKLRWRKQEPVSLPSETPTLLPNIIDMHIKQLDFSWGDLSELLMVDEQAARDEYGPPQSTDGNLRLVR